jgi:hypothetical protein
MGISALIDAIGRLTADVFQNGTIFDRLRFLNEQFSDNWLFSLSRVKSWTCGRYESSSIAIPSARAASATSGVGQIGIRNVPIPTIDRQSLQIRRDLKGVKNLGGHPSSAVRHLR